MGSKRGAPAPRPAGARNEPRCHFETALARIAAAVASVPGAKVTITQIKEKYGALRIYFDDSGLSEDAEARVEEAIDLAEYRAACTCENCGAEASSTTITAGTSRAARRMPKATRCRWCQAKTSTSGACSWTASCASSRRTATTARDAFVEVPIAALEDD
jgi:hypothetical protein